MILKIFMTCIAFAYKDGRDSNADLVELNRSKMDSSRPHRVKGDLGSLPNSPASVDGGQASHAPLMNDQGQATGGAMDILQQIAQALQRAAQSAIVVPQRSAIERMAKYRPMDFLGKIDDELAMEKNWLERTERMLQQMHCTSEKNLECATSLLQDEAYRWWLSFGGYYMGVLSDRIQEAICGSHLFEQYETRVS